jgi:hypothetical protein
MNYTKAESLQNIEQTMRTLKLGGLAKEWRSVVYHDNEQYMRDLLDIEVREREANRMARMIKQAGFRVIKTLDNFVWKPTIEIPTSITREEIETASFVKEKENLVLMSDFLNQFSNDKYKTEVRSQRSEVRGLRLKGYPLISVLWLLFSVF